MREECATLAVKGGWWGLWVAGEGDVRGDLRQQIPRAWTPSLSTSAEDFCSTVANVEGLTLD